MYDAISAQKMSPLSEHLTSSIHHLIFLSWIRVLLLLCCLSMDFKYCQWNIDLFVRFSLFYKLFHESKLFWAAIFNLKRVINLDFQICIVHVGLPEMWNIWNRLNLDGYLGGHIRFSHWRHIFFLDNIVITGRFEEKMG